MESSLPTIEQAKQMYKMRMESLAVQDYPSEHRMLNADICENGDQLQQMVHVFKIEEPRVAGYLPTKVWWADDKMNMGFYCSDTLPPNARPFDGGPTYVLWFDVAVGTTVEYDIEWRVFIDQLIIDDRLTYVFVFGQQMYDKITSEYGSN